MSNRCRATDVGTRTRGRCQQVGLRPAGPAATGDDASRHGMGNRFGPVVIALRTEAIAGLGINRLMALAFDQFNANRYPVHPGCA
jgi:hypothetical protein